jgi:ATP/maltotriose-dependent transcriptional regulator MalT
LRLLELLEEHREVGSYANLLLKSVDREDGKGVQKEITRINRSGDLSSQLVEGLSEREMEVLFLVKTGMTSKEIAEELFIAVSTVRSHLKNIYSKLDVHSRMEAIQKAEELGLL